MDGPRDASPLSLVRPLPRALEVLQPLDGPVRVDAGLDGGLLVQLVDETVDALVLREVGLGRDAPDGVRGSLARKLAL